MSTFELDGRRFFTGIVRDIAERKDAEARLREQAELLERAHEALREADRRKDEFLAMLAHELRNPLAPIRYAIASVKSVPRISAQRADADEVIERQVAHMSRLLDDLLDVSRITMGKLELKKQPTELCAVLDAAVEAARPSLDVKGHSLCLDLPAHSVWLIADPVRLTQVFSNLLINAAKYTDAGGRIDMSASVDGGKVTVRVRDNGVGIAREILPRLLGLRGFEWVNSAHFLIKCEEACR